MTHTFVLEGGNILISLPFEKYEQLPLQIKSSLYNDNKYVIKSKVCLENFQNFMNNYKDNTKPEINLSNMYEYYLLSKEFEIMKDNFENTQILHLSLLKYKFIDQIPSEKSNSEKSISTNLDFFIDKYPDLLGQIPIESLYNIFYHKERNLQDENKAYNFITRSSNIYFLLNSLKDSNLTEDIVLDSLSKIEEHSNFCPQIASVKDQISTLKKAVEENSDTEIIEFLFPQQGSDFEGKFVYFQLFQWHFKFKNLNAIFFKTFSYNVLLHKAVNEENIKMVKLLLSSSKINVNYKTIEYLKISRSFISKFLIMF